MKQTKKSFVDVTCFVAVFACHSLCKDLTVRMLCTFARPRLWLENCGIVVGGSVKS